MSPGQVDMLKRGLSPIVEAEIGELITNAVAHGPLRDRKTSPSDRAERLSLISVGTPSCRGRQRRVERGGCGDRGDRRGARRKAAACAWSCAPPCRPAPPRSASFRAGGRIRPPDRRRLYYYSNPEFLREGIAVHDFRAPPFTLIGAAAGDDAPRLREIYAPIAAPLHVVPYRVAESVKYLSNVYHAVKLAFANEAGAVLAAHGVDAPEAFRLLCEDRVLNVSPAYLRPGFAFGGSCLPKDVRSFLSLADAQLRREPFLTHVLPSNQAIIDRAFDAIARHGRQRVSLFGLAFKQGTDDLREFPFVLLAERLIGRGYELRIFDRSVKVARLLGANRSYIEQEIPHLERLMVVSPGRRWRAAGSP